MSFEPSEEEKISIRKFMDKHTKRHGTYAGAIDGRFSFEFTPTGLGTVVIIKCACRKKRNVTDFESW